MCILVNVAFALGDVMADGDADLVSTEHPKWTMPMWLENVPVMWRGGVFTHKSLYVGEVFVGTPPRKFRLVLDTGSGNTVLPQSGCFSLGCLSKQHYSVGASTSSRSIISDLKDKYPGGMIYIKYGDGDLSGSFVRDIICLAENQTQCTDLDMVQSHRMSTNPFALFPVDGVLGLGLASLSLNTSFSFVHQMMNQHPGMKRLLSVYLSHDRCGNLITFGGYDETRADGPPQWVDVVQKELGYWQVSARSLEISGVAQDYCNDGECRVVTDLGSTLIVVPTDVNKLVQDTIARLVPVELYNDEFDCLTYIPETHNIKLDLGEFSISLPPKEFMNPKPLRRTYSNGTLRHVCTTRIHHIDFPPPLKKKTFIFGHPLLRTYYTVYDWERGRIGLARTNTNQAPITCPEREAPHPIYVRSLDSDHYYLPHLTGEEPEMEALLQSYRTV